MATRARPGRYAPVGFQQITSLSAAVSLTIPSTANGRASAALIQATTQNVRWRDDGTNPTTTVGVLLAGGSDMFYDGDLNALKFIETASAATLNISYYEDSRGGQ